MNSATFRIALIAGFACLLLLRQAATGGLSFGGSGHMPPAPVAAQPSYASTAARLYHAQPSYASFGAWLFRR